MDPYGHADGMLRFVDEQTLLVHSNYRDDSVLSHRLTQAGFQLEYLDLGPGKKDDRSWAYLNFLQTKDFMMVPKFGIDEDERALEALQQYYPDYKDKIVQIDMRETVPLGGTLNCISWSVKE
jgi:agmatine/peptidylarginine deiminase